MSQSCSCKSCRACCKHLPGALARVEDLESLAQATWKGDESLEDWAARELVASAGYRLEDRRTGERYDVPTLALRPKLDGSCRHFNLGRCMIYENAPSACREFDTHDHNEQHSAQLAMALARSMNEPDGTEAGSYWSVYGMLKKQGLVKTRDHIRKQRRRLERALDRIERRKR